MSAVDLYPLVKSVHQLSVALSLSLFTARWLGVLSHAQWPMQKATRQASMTIDSVLLVAGLTLWTLGRWDPIQDIWLGLKWCALVVYVVLGSWALRRARSRTGQCVFGVLALATATHMVGMALHHSPMGWAARPIVW